MSDTLKKTLVTAMAITMMMAGALNAFAAEEVTTGPATDGTTDGTSVAAVTSSDPVVKGQIRTSSISSERTVPETAVVYYFVYSGPGSVDCDADDPDGCLVSFADAAHSVMKHCAR